MCQELVVDKLVEYIYLNCRTVCILLSSKAHGKREARNQWNPCLLMRYIVFSSFQRNNGEHASKGPCRAGFSQSFYSVLISRDVLQDLAIVKGKMCNRRVSSVTLFFWESVQCQSKSPSVFRPLKGNVCCREFFSNACPRMYVSDY